MSAKSREYFETMLANLKKSKQSFKARFVPPGNEACTKASFRIAHHLLKQKKPYTEGETIVSPCLRIACEELFGPTSAEKITKIPLSNDTIARRAEEMSDDLEEQIICAVKLSPWYGLQFDESTDTVSEAQLLVYVRFVDMEQEDIMESYLFCLPVREHANGKTIFTRINEYITKADISWKKLANSTADGAAANFGKNSGVLVRIERKAPQSTKMHCMIHREALAPGRLAAGGEVSMLSEFLKEVVKIVNFIKANPLKCRIFAILCKETDAEAQTLLLHCESRWLSRGKVLNRFYLLRPQIRQFLYEQGDDRYRLFDDNQWVAQLAYMSDVFLHLNKLNLSLQGKNKDVFHSSDKLKASSRRLQCGNEM